MWIWESIYAGPTRGPASLRRALEVVAPPIPLQLPFPGSDSCQANAVGDNLYVNAGEKMLRAAELMH